MKYHKQLGYKWYALLLALLVFSQISRFIMIEIIFLFEGHNNYEVIEQKFQKHVGHIGP